MPAEPSYGKFRKDTQIVRFLRFCKGGPRETEPKSSPNLGARETTPRKWPYLLISMRLKCQILQGHPNRTFSDIFAKGGPRETEPKSRPTLDLRRRNTRHKNSQLVAQHCFVASFCRCFPFFTLRDQLLAEQKHLLRVEESCREK